jgi:hypothetical protein
MQPYRTQVISVLPITPGGAVPTQQSSAQSPASPTSPHGASGAMSAIGSATVVEAKHPFGSATAVGAATGTASNRASPVGSPRGLGMSGGGGMATPGLGTPLSGPSSGGSGLLSLRSDSPPRSLSIMSPMSPRVGGQAGPLVPATPVSVRRAATAGRAFNFSAVGPDGLRTSRRHGAALFFGVAASDMPSPSQVLSTRSHGPNSVFAAPFGATPAGAPGAGTGLGTPLTGKSFGTEATGAIAGVGRKVCFPVGSTAQGCLRGARRRRAGAQRGSGRARVVVGACGRKQRRSLPSLRSCF